MIAISPRERQVAELMLKGCSNAEIARVLKISPATVKQHLWKVYLKYGISGDAPGKRAELKLKLRPQ